MATTDLIIVGAGGLGREIASMLHFSSLRDHFRIIGWVDDALATTESVLQWKVLGDLKWLEGHTEKVNLAIAIGNSRTRQSVTAGLRQKPHLVFPNIIHPGASLHNPETIEMGKGNIICDGSIFTTNIKMGDFNLINLSCTIGHDVEMGDCCSLMPGVNISGGARLGHGVYVGTGARLIKATTLGDGCTIGAGAVVNTDVPPGKTFAGVPAKQISNE